MSQGKGPSEPDLSCTWPEVSLSEFHAWDSGQDEFFDHAGHNKQCQGLGNETGPPAPSGPCRALPKCDNAAVV